MTAYRRTPAVYVPAVTPPTDRRPVSCSRAGPGDRIAGPEYTTLQAPRPHRAHPPDPTLPRQPGYRA
jgi:hypothetical protein